MSWKLQLSWKCVLENVLHQLIKIRAAVKECCGDPLMIAKMSFYLYVVKQIAPFLTSYQSDKPMLPFIASDLYDMTRALMARYMKPEALKDVTTAQKLVCVDVTNQSLESNYKKVEVGFKSERLLKDLLATKQISEKREMEFRQEGKSFLKVLVQRLMKKSPLQYTLARNMNCLDPRKMAKGKEACIYTEFETMLTNTSRSETHQ